MKLTNDIRGKIVRNMAVDSLSKERAALTKRENQIAIDLWKAVYPESERDAALLAAPGWIRMDKC